MDDRDDKGRFIKGNKSKGGRPKGTLSINDEIRKLLATKDDKTGKKYIEVIAYKIFQEALKDNDRVLIEMWQQMEGRPKQQVDLANANDEPLVIKHIYPKEEDNE